MNKLFFVLGIGLLLWGNESNAQGHNIKITVKDMPNQSIILANYFEGKAYAADTAKLDGNGIGYFKNSKKKLARGMYLLFFSPSNQFDILIGDNQNFSIQTDTLNIMKTMQIEGSPENLAFLDFQKFMMDQNQKTRTIRETYDKEKDKDNEEVKKQYIAQFDNADKEVRIYIENLVNAYPGSALATFANFTLSPVIPDFSKEIPEGTKDRDLEIQRRAYYYNKDHYWDYTNLADSTLMRTPIFKNKLDDYFNNMLLMHPDTVYKESVKLIERSRSCRAMYRYLVSYCFNFSLESKIMGMDEAFVKISKKYYTGGKADWIDKENMKKIEEEVMKLEYNLVGHKALDLKLPMLEGTWTSLYETKAPFTVLLFWEPNCGHCKKQVPLIKKELYDKFSPYGLKVFAVNTHTNKEEWEQFVTEHELFDFVNCWDPNRQSNYWTIYNVLSTPVFYLLDKDKKIVAKKLDVEQLADILTKEFKRMGVEIK